ncbi:MAG TPA: LLM class flavin-dependent oxidoreductase [Ilumatobacter sp.]|nr:LLM class flavin-dependent oxidoreductase [Ilumatobacter sp.]
MNRLQAGFVPVDWSADEIAEIEQLGADSFWAPGHIASGREDPECVVGVTRLATLTSTATVGTAVLLASLYHPVLVAKQFAELDRLTNGRVTLGVGVGGEYPSEFNAMGVSIEERGPRTDEAIDLIKALWRQPAIEHHGRFWSMEDVGIAPPPCRLGGPPIIVAGRKSPAMRRAARVGDGWMPFLFSPDQYRTSVEAIREEAASAGRELTDFQWLCFLYVSLDDDRETAKGNALEFIGTGQAGDGARFGPLIDRVAATGTTSDVIGRLQQFVDAGVQHFVLLPCSRDNSVEQARRLLSDVMPEIRVTTGVHQ